MCIYMCALGKRKDLRQMQVIKMQMVYNSERTCIKRFMCKKKLKK